MIRFVLLVLLILVLAGCSKDYITRPAAPAPADTTVVDDDREDDDD